MLTTAKLDAMGHRWVASLGNYYFDLHYKPGKRNPADPLSRIDWSYLDNQTVKATLDLARIDRTTLPDVGVNETESLLISKGLQAGKNTQVWKRRQEEDPLLAKLKGQLRKGELEKDSLDQHGLRDYRKVRRDLVLSGQILYHRVQLKDHDQETYQFVVPVKYRKRALELVHDEFGHLGIDRTMGLMQERFYWPHMSDDIRTYICDCMRCIKFKQKGEQEEMVSIKATYLLQLVHMDFLQIGSKRADKGKPIYVLVITDHFTRYAQAYVTTNQTAHTVAEVFIHKYVVNYGWPEKILTDQAQDFEGKVFKKLCDQALIKKLRTSPYHPQGNGQPERFNCTLLTMLGTLPNDAKKKWGEWVALLTQAYNCSPS